MGFFGNSAPYPADLNLVLQITVLAFLVAAAYLAKIENFKIHGRLMISAIAIQFGAVFLWMVPSLIRNLGALGSGGVGAAITMSHFYFATFTLALTIAAVTHWAEIRLRWTMRLTFTAWFLVAVLGILFYAHYYLAIL